MSFVAEPFGLFVDDLLTGLTGGVVREGFRFLPEDAPFRLDPPAPLLRNTVRVHGISAGAHTVFRTGTDYAIGADDTVVWQQQPDGSPRPGAVLPDTGSRVWVNYEHQGLVEAAPRLTDRNPGSVTRLIAETFAREYAVISGQLDAVYQAAFIDTASGRDLDQLALLLGVTRVTASAASGSIVFARRTPSPADVSIPAGTRVSTSDAPPTLFETTEARTLRRGEISVEAPIRALAAGRDGIVAAGAIGVLHRPLLGIDSVANPQATAFATAAEDDGALRARLRRRLEASGRATTGALIGALSGIPGVREKDIRVAEDPISRPGLIEIDVALPPQQQDAAALDDVAARALALIEETRPAGVRVLARLAAPPLPAGETPPPPGGIPDEGPSPVQIVASDTLFFPVDVNAVLVPTTLGLSAAEQNTLRAAGESEIRAFIEAAGLGEALVYNQLVSRLMAIPGILDVALEMSPAGEAGAKRKNILPGKPAARAAAGAITVRIGGLLVVLDISLRITLKGAGLEGPPELQRENARQKVESELRAGVATLAPDDGSGSGTVTVAALRALLLTADEYTVDDLHFQASYEDAGLRVLQRDPALPITGLERFWIGAVTLSNEADG
jgi:phage-related baseplate assembly protein